MTIYRFIKECDERNDYDRMSLEMKLETVGLDDLIVAFGDFLRGCGFSFAGRLDTVNEDDTEVQQNGWMNLYRSMTLEDPDYAVGPFDTEDAARANVDITDSSYLGTYYMMDLRSRKEGE